MGNEASSPAGEGSLPQMVLYLETLMISSGRQNLSWASDAGGDLRKPFVQDVSSSSSSAPVLLDSETFSARVSIDGVEVACGRVDRFPSQPIPIEPCALHSELQLEFFFGTERPGSKTSADSVPWSTVITPLSKLLPFGAPLYTAVWLGLERTEDFGGQRPPTSLLDAMQRAYLPDPRVPKVKVTLFKPSPMDLRDLHKHLQDGTIASWKPKPDVKSPFNAPAAGLDCMEPDGSPAARAGGMQLEGLVRCVRESNAVMNKLQQAALGVSASQSSIAEDKSIIGQMLHELKQINKESAEAERKWAADALESAPQQLRGHIEAEKETHTEALNRLVDAHYDEISRNDAEIEAIHDAAQERLINLGEEQKEAVQRLRQEVRDAARSVEAKVTAARMDWQRQAAKQLAEANDVGRRYLQEASQQKDEVLLCKRNGFAQELSGLQQQIEQARVKLSQVLSEKESLEAAVRGAAQDTKNMTTIEAGRILAARETAQHEVEAIEAQTLKESQLCCAEITELKAEFGECVRNKSDMLARAEQERMEDLAAMANEMAGDLRLKGLQADTQINELVREHEERIERERLEWQNKCNAYDQQLTDLRVDVEQQGQEVLVTTELLGQLERESIGLAVEANELKSKQPERESELQSVSAQKAANVTTANAEVANARSEKNQIIARSRMDQAGELVQMAADRSKVLAQCEEQRRLLKKDLDEQREASSQTFFGIIKTWEHKCIECTEATRQAQVGLKHNQDTAPQVLEELRSDWHDRHASLEVQGKQEITALQRQLDSVSKRGEQDSGRLSTELETIKAETKVCKTQITENLQRELESHRMSVEGAHDARMSALATKLRQVQLDRDSSIAQQKHDLGDHIAPLVAEVEELQELASMLPDAERDNQSLTEQISSMRFLIHAATSAHSESKALLAERSGAAKNAEQETSTIEVDVSSIQQQIKDSQQELEASRQVHNTALSAVVSDRGRALKATERQISDLELRLASRREDLHASRKSQLDELEIRQSEEKASLETMLASLQLEIEKDKVSADRHLAELQENAARELQTQVVAKQEASEQVRESQAAFEVLRSVTEEAANGEQRNSDAKVSSVQIKARKELLNQLQASRVALQTTADTQQGSFARLQAEHESDRQHFKKLLADQETVANFLQNQLARSEQEADNAAAVVAGLQKDIATRHEQHARDLKTAGYTQDAALEDLTRLAGERQVKNGSDLQDEAEQWTLKVRTARAEVHQLTSDLTALRASGDRQKLATDRAAERRLIEMEQLKERLHVLDAAITSERGRNSDKLMRREREAADQKTKLESNEMICRIDQERLQGKLDTVRQELEVTRERLKVALMDVEGQERQSEFQRQLDVEAQERSFKQQHRQQEARYINEREAKQEAQRQALEDLRVGHQAELQRLQASLAALRKQCAEIESVPQKVVATRSELEQLQAQGNAIQASVKDSAKESVDERQQELDRLEALHTSRLDEAHAHFKAVLSQHKQTADAARLDLEEQMSREQKEFAKKLAANQGDIDLQKTEQTRIQVEFDGQLEQDLKDLQQKADGEMQAVMKDIEEVRNEQERLSTARGQREAETSRDFVQELSKAGKKSDEEASMARDSMTKEVELEVSEAQLILQAELTDAKDNIGNVKQSLEKSMEDLAQAHLKDIASEDKKAAAESKQMLQVQKDLEEKLATAQAYLGQMQLDIEEKTKMHELALQEESANENAQLEKTRRQLRMQQAGLVAELTEAQQTSQDSLRHMQDGCFSTIDRVRQEALRDSEKRVKDGTSKMRVDLWQAQQIFNVWQKRMDKASRELVQLGHSEPIGAKDDTAEAHPLEYILNRLLLRVFRGLLEEKQATVGEEDLRSLFNIFPRANESSQQALLTNEDFRDAVLKSLSCKRRFDLRKFARLLDQTPEGAVTLKDWHSRCETTLGLERDTIMQIYQLAENGARLDKQLLSVPRKLPAGYLHEDDLINFLDHPQVRRVFCWGAGIDDEIEDSVDRVSGISESRCSSAHQIDTSSTGRNGSRDITRSGFNDSSRRKGSPESPSAGIGKSKSLDSFGVGGYAAQFPYTQRLASQPGEQSQSYTSLGSNARNQNIADTSSESKWV